jgi:TolB-like protein/tetratricopeptide (TPR) repeat protein
VRRRTRAHIRATEEYETEDETHALLESGPIIKSLAVLPFIMIGAQSSEDYLGLGLADALITRLSSVRQMIVRPTSAICTYIDAQRDVVLAGRELRVSTVLEGTVQRAGERLRVTLNLLDVRDGTSLWADKIQATFTDIFEVQDLIAEQVAQRLAVKLNTALDRRPTESAEAYKLYLQGRYFLSKSDPEGVRSAIEAFQQAVTTDTEFAEAYAGLAESYIIASYLYLSHKQALPLAREAAEKALELNGTLAEAHNSLAAARWMYDWNWEGAERAFRRALALNPNLATAHRWFGLFLAWGRRFDESIAELTQAIELDPLSLFHNAYLGLALYLARRYEAAIEQCFKTLELDPNNLPSMGFIGLSYIEQGKIEDAISMLERQRQVMDAPLLLSELGYAYARGGKMQEALKLLAELKARPSTPPEYLALIYAGLGDKDQAFAWLDRAYEERTVMLPVIYADPKYDNLRSDPRFAELLSRMNLK